MFLHVLLFFLLGTSVFAAPADSGKPKTKAAPLDSGYPRYHQPEETPEYYLGYWFPIEAAPGVVRHYC